MDFLANPIAEIKDSHSHHTLCVPLYSSQNAGLCGAVRYALIAIENPAGAIAGTQIRL